MTPITLNCQIQIDTHTNNREEIQEILNEMNLKLQELEGSPQIFSHVEIDISEEDIENYIDYYCEEVELDEMNEEMYDKYTEENKIIKYYGDYYLLKNEENLNLKELEVRDQIISRYHI